ncbi:MAG: ribosome biogenesis GTPase Der [Desulfovibrionaceae bacterium]|nr:ribosome biogenesis GTPase Der [Desulfovibrionaceae bacterium]
MTPPKKVALLGRPNVGKSTLFNRLIRSNRAITHDRPGVTRDRMEGVVKSKGKETFLLVDTGGVTLDSHARVQEGPEGIRGFEQDILDQAKDALAESDLVCLVVDGRDGLTPLDKHLADYLRKTGKPLLLVVNKIDGPERQDIFLAEFHGLGLETVPVSAAHGYNVRALEDEIRERLFLALPDEALEQAAERELLLDGATRRQQKRLKTALRETLVMEEDSVEDGNDAENTVADAATDASTEHASLEDTDPADADDTAADDYVGPDLYSGPLRLALLGRPNAGKSSLVNAMLGEKRMIVSDVAGTTRDSVDVTMDIDGEPVTFVDTAGVRRRAKITDVVERYSVNSSLKSTTKAHVTLLVLDASEGLAGQDKRLIDLLHERKTPFLVLINKSDLIEPKKRKEAEKLYKEALIFCPHVPLLFVSALNRHNLKKIVPLARSIRRECGMRVPTGQLNRAMSTVLERHQPPIVKQARAKFFYLTQAESLPPTFVFFVNDADRVLPSYARYLERSLRKIFGIAHAPMRVNFRSSHSKRGGKR